MVKHALVIIVLMLLLCGCSNQKTDDKNVVTFPDITDSDAFAGTEEVTQPIVSDTEETNADSMFDTEQPPQVSESSDVLTGKFICIDPGHGSFEKGYQEAIGPGSSKTKPAFVSGTSGQFQSEAEFNLKLSFVLKEMLEERGAVVYMTRTTEVAELSNIGRAEFANNKNCDMVVRIHADGSENTSVNGISVLIPGYNEFLTDANIIDSSRLCGQYVLDGLLDATSAADRGLIVRNDLTGFNWTKVPCILVECGFMSNPEDDKKLADPAYRTKLAEGIINGLTAYYETV